MMDLITSWERYNAKKKTWEHNHISDDFQENEVVPIPRSEIQEKSWKGATWRKNRAYLKNGKVTLV